MEERVWEVIIAFPYSYERHGRWITQKKYEKAFLESAKKDRWAELAWNQPSIIRRYAHEIGLSTTEMLEDCPEATVNYIVRISSPLMRIYVSENIACGDARDDQNPRPPEWQEEVHMYAGDERSVSQ